MNCEFEKAKRHFDTALHINAAANLAWGISTVKSSIALFVYGFQGNSELAYNTSNNALGIAEGSGDIYSNAFAYTSHAKSSFLKGFFEEGEKCALKALRLCERSRHFLMYAYILSLLGEIYFETGDYRESQKYYDRSNRLLEKGKIMLSMVYLNNIGKARAKAINNEGGISVKPLLHSIENNKLKMQEGLMLRYLGDVLINTNDHSLSDAENCIRKALQVHERNGMLLYLGCDYALYAELFKRKGDPLKAKENLSKAIKICKKCGADGWVDKYEKQLAAIT
jgi:tetratricopeptide (TPR) repeat protein